MTAAECGGEVAIFDLLSHADMHHAFNEGYIRTVKAAFPESSISFHACEGQIRYLSRRVADLDKVTLTPCPAFKTPFGLSRHNPVAGNWAALECLRTIVRRITPGKTRLVAVLGIDANLFAVLGRRWPSNSSVPLHMILHSHLGDAMIWRSRNPLIRYGDFVSRLSRPLPRQVYLVVLELGIKSAIEELAPHLGPSILTLEHPVLETEWSTAGEASPGQKIRIAFLGHARRAKGFPAFLDLARRSMRPELDFTAIGLSSPDTAELDAGPLTRLPSRAPLPRAEYLRLLSEADFICLPLHARTYDFTASGTVSDAIAALKPLLARRNRALDEIVERYGPIGYLVDTHEELCQRVQKLDRAAVAEQRPIWLQNLRRLRQARRPSSLAQSYGSFCIYKQPSRCRQLLRHGS
jgi:glycosyltransferase involved in cell wall biosynthesis